MIIALGIIFFLFLSAFFSGSEIAYISANKLQVEVEKQKGKRSGKILAKFYDDPKGFLATMLVGNNIALVVFTLLITEILKQIFPNANYILSSLFNALVTTLIVLLFGEYLPKTFFHVFANKILHFFAYPLAFFRWLLFIPTWIMTKLSNFIIKYIFRAPIENAEISFSRVDLENFIGDDSSQDSEEEIDKDLFKNALNLKNTRVRDCMVPRPEIDHLDINSSMEELLETFQKTKHSRIIITDEDIDNIVGYVHHQQMLDNPKSIRKILMHLPFVPEAMNAGDLMSNFRNTKTYMACVVDEYGGTAGIITLEDILEEIFGEIEDEHDSEDYIETAISENEYIFSGRLEIDYLNDKYELDLPEGEYQTLSGYLVMTDGSIPEQGDIIELDKYQFIIELVSEKKIETVRLIRLFEEGVDEVE